jgi:hypothetical protein
MKNETLIYSKEKKVNIVTWFARNYVFETFPN